MGRQNRWQPGWLRPLLILGAMWVSLALTASPARAIVDLTSTTPAGWTAVTPANGQHDYLTDQQTSSGQSVPQDIVGDNTYRSAYVKYDDGDTPNDVSDDWLAFRLRVNNTNSTSPVSNGFDKFAFFGVDHGLDGDIDFFVGVYNPSHTSQGQIGVYDADGAGNTGPNDTGIAGSPTVTYDRGTDNWSSMWSFVQATDGSNFSGQPDYFISFQVKVADINAVKATFGITSDITKETTLRYIVGTAAQDNAFNQDISGMQGWSSSGTWESLGVFTPVVTADGSAPPNTAPAFVGGTTALTVNEGAAATSVKDLLHVSDSDAGQTVTWTVYSAPTTGVLNIISATASSGSADITPGGTITYQPTANTTGADSFVIQVSDGTDTATRTINVTINDVDPVISDATVSLAENSPNGTAVTTVTATGDTDGLSHSITAGNTNGAFAIDSSTGEITVANSPALDYETTPTFTLTVTVDDEDADNSADATATVTINLTNVNEAPISSDSSVTTVEDTVYTFSAADFSFNDPDGDSLAKVQITSLPAAGSLKLSGTDVTLNQEITAANIGDLTFTSASNANGTPYATFRFKVGDGTLYSASAYTITVNVTAVNDAPTASNSTITVNGSTAYTFTAGNFNFSDVDSGDSLAKVQVTLLPAAGSLKLSGAAVTANQEITVADINAGNLTFEAAAGASGSNYASFGFKVSDGTSYSTSAYTMTVDVAGTPTAAQSMVTADPTSVAADGTTTSTITVTLKDANGNPVSGKTVTLAQGTGSSTISAASGPSDADGVVTFTVKSTTAETVTYTATDTTDNVTITQTAAVTFTAVTSTAAKLAITSTAVSGAASNTATLGPITVQLQDASGNPVNAGTGGVTVNLSSNTTGTAVFSTSSGGSAVTSVTIPSGSSSATFYYGDTKAGTPTITAASTNLTSARQVETITTGAAVKLAITSNAVRGLTSSTARLGPITVQLQDAFGNAVTAGAGGVTVNLSSNTTGTAVFSATRGGSSVTSVTIPAGSSSVSFYYGDTQAGSPTITAASTGLASATQVATLTTARLVFTSRPVSGAASDTAGLGPITVQLRDDSGNAVTAWTGGVTVRLSSNTAGTAVFSATRGGSAVTSVTIPSGSSRVSFYYGDTRAGTPTITAASAGLTSATQVETITAGAAAKLAITSTSVVSGATSSTATLGPITVELQDAFGNAVTAGAGGVRVNLSSDSTGTKVFSATSGGTPVTSVTIPRGSSSTTFYYGDTQAGTPEITATATGLAPATKTLTVFANASKLAITSTPVSGMASSTAGLGPITVQLQDVFGNPVTAGAGGVTVSLSSDSADAVFSGTRNGTPVTTVTIPRGSNSAVFYYGDANPGTPTITASATDLTSATQTEDIFAAASKLAITTGPVSGVVSPTPTLGPITVELQDASNTPVVAGTNGVTVNVSSDTQGVAKFAATSGGTAVTSVTIPGGSSSATFYYADTKAGTPTITAASAGLTAATQTETITAAAAVKLVITSAPLSGTASGTATLGPVTVQLQDEYGNPVTAGPGGVTVDLSSDSAGAVFSATSGGAAVTSVTIPDGDSSVSFYYGDINEGTPTITAASAGLTSATQQAFIGDANAVLELTADPSSIVGDGQSRSTLRIRLVNSNGTGLAQIPVTVNATAGTLSDADPVTGSDGTVFVTLTAPLIEATAPRIERVTASVSTGSLRAFRTIEVTFLPATIHGVIVDQSTGLAIPGAEVWVSEDFDGDGTIDFTARTITAGDGSYDIVVPRGNWPYRVNFRAPVKVGNSTVNIESTQISQVGQLQGIGEQIDAAKTISGVILAAADQGTQSIAPLISQGAQVAAQIRTASGEAVAQEVSITEDGAFKVDGVADGDYKLSFQVTSPTGEELVGPTVSVTVSHAGEAALSVALIDPFGTVTNAGSGAPINGVNMSLYWADTAANIAAGRTPDTLVALPALPDFPPNQNANPQSTTAAGSYAWLVFPDGDYYITATKSGYLPYDSRQDTRFVVIGNSYVQNGVIHVGTDIVEFNLEMDPVQSGSSTTPVAETGEHRRYIRGYPDGTFRPERSISRAEVATILARVKGLKEVNDSFSYPDVTAAHWASGFIEAVRKAGLMMGDPDGKFRPDAPISRAEVAAIAVRFKGLAGGKGGSAFSDIQGHWAEDVIGIAYQAQIIEGYNDGTYRTQKQASRAEFVTIMNRMLGRGPLTGRPAPRWGDVPWSHWAVGQVEEASISHTFIRHSDGSEKWTSDITDQIR